MYHPLSCLQKIGLWSRNWTIAKAPGEDNITGSCSTRWWGSHSQPPHSTLQQMPSTVPSSKAWQNVLMVLLHKKGITSDIKNYRPNQFAPHHLQNVFTHPLAMDTVDSGLPLALRIGWLQIRLLNEWPSSCCQPTPRKSAWVQHPTVLCIHGLWGTFQQHWVSANLPCSWETWSWQGLPQYHKAPVLYGNVFDLPTHR